MDSLSGMYEVDEAGCDGGTFGRGLNEDSRVCGLFWGFCGGKGLLGRSWRVLRIVIIRDSPWMIGDMR